MDTATAPIAHHWILTLSGHIDGTPVAIGGHGATRITPGTSRHGVCEQMVQELLATFHQKTGAALQNHCIAHFTLEPDEL
ncbi:hypothetical protein [Streptomyces lydicus]|uniref:hypothetical protein n=1 Tax=Streptomyces lydicus TaxID=47763 RepID=UPI00378A7D9F